MLSALKKRNEENGSKWNNKGNEPMPLRKLNTMIILTEIEKKVENLHLTNFISHEVVCLAAIVLTYMDMEVGSLAMRI